MINSLRHHVGTALKNSVGIIFSSLSLILLVSSCRMNPAHESSAKTSTDTDAAGIEISEINPDRSDLQGDSNGAAGGRINGLGATPGNRLIYYAASEWGGLFKTTDGGNTWFRLDGHLPVATWRIKVNPKNPQLVYATSFYDGKVDSLSGINVSWDGGQTWIHPPQKPEEDFCLDSWRRDEPSAFGIAVDEDDPRNVYVGTNCGLAVSNDSGKSWHYINPTTNNNADDVWDVVVHHGGIIDICGDEGHLRSVKGGPFSGSRTPTGMCALAVSPLESSVIFVHFGRRLYESDDGGTSWSATLSPSYQGRVPFLATNLRDAHSFDLWYGDIRLYRAACTGPMSAGSDTAAHRCPKPDQWKGPYTTDAGAHDDSGGIAFDPNGCPVLFASDGGVYRNLVTTSPECQEPHWIQPAIAPHALWLFAMDDLYKTDKKISLYVSMQDNGTFTTEDARAPRPDWNNRNCCDSFDVIASQDRVVYTLCCFENNATKLWIGNTRMTGGGELGKYPDGALPGWMSQIIGRFAESYYALFTDVGVFITKDISKNAVDWEELGSANSPSGICNLQVSVSANKMPTFYVQTNHCDGSGGRLDGSLQEGASIFRFDGTDPDGQWQMLKAPEDGGGFGTFTSSPINPDHILASFVRKNGEPMMVSTDDGGKSWKPLTKLDALMTQGGKIRYRTFGGPSDFTRFDGYIQPSLLMFDPDDERNIIAGGIDSGIFLSFDGGATWRVVADSGKTYIPRPRFARFDHHIPHELNIYVGSQGRGMWRIMLPMRKPS